MSGNNLERKGFSEWRSPGVTKRSAKEKATFVELESAQRDFDAYDPILPSSIGSGFVVPTAQMLARVQNTERHFEEHPNLTIRSIDGATRTADLKPVLHDIAFEEGGIPVWNWKANDEAIPITAVFHSDIREQLIDLAKSKGSYGHAPEAGPGPADVTAFHSPHSYWQEEREHRPEVLKKFLPPPNHTASTEKDVGFLYYKTSLVLDYRTHPLKAHDMPLTFSSNLEGWRLEAIRRTDPHISLKDIEARVPVVESLDSNGTFSCKPVCDENALAARARRFRERTGNVSWCAREGSEAIRKFMASLLTAEALRNNSALDRDLTKSEMAQLRMLNLGRNPERARKTNRSAADCKEARNKYVQKAHDLFTTTAGRETEKEVSRHYEAGHAYSASNAHSASTVHGASVAGNDYGFNNDHDASNTYVSSDIYGGSNVDGSSNDASNPDGLNNVNSAGYPSNTTSGYDSNFDHLMSGFDPVAHQEGIHSDEVPLTAACGTFSTDDLSSGNIDWSGVFDDNNVLDNQIFSAPEGGQFTAGDGLDTFSPMMNDRTFDLNETLGDSRYETPKSYNEVVDIRAALSPSVNEFIQTTAQYLYPKLPTGSYLVQHDRLQKYYEAQWWPQHQGQAPRLPIRVFWSGGIKNWLTSELLPTEVYGSEDLIRNNPNYFMGLGPST